MQENKNAKRNGMSYFNDDELATNVWISKYALKDSKGNLIEQSVNSTKNRLVTSFNSIEKKFSNPLSYMDIFDMIFGTVMPGGSLIYGIGNTHTETSLGNCFVIGSEEDSYGGICKTEQEQIQLMKRRAGVGHDLSHIRAKGSFIHNSAATSTGIVPFMKRYSNSTREVAQEGRRGALMLSLDINHRNINDFIDAKLDTKEITGANISVKIDDRFMNTLRYSKQNDELFKKITDNAWNNGEPGVLFWDSITKESPADCYPDFKSVSTNPCGEIPLCPYDSCRLLSIVLYEFVINPFTPKAYFSFVEFKKVAYKAQILMDDVVELERMKIDNILEKIEKDPEQLETKLIEKNLWLKIKNKLLRGRRTGLSGIGLADTLAALGLDFTSDEGIRMADSIYKILARESYKASIDMAESRGAFPAFDPDKERDNPFIKRLFRGWEAGEEKDKYYNKYKKYGRRNIANLTIPPSGSISIIAQVSSGIEPVYSLYYRRKRKVEAGHPNISFIDDNGDCWEEYNVAHPKLKVWFKKNIKDISWKDFLSDDSLWLDTIKQSPWYKNTAREISPRKRIELQSVIQKHVDHSISSTVNLPKEITKDDVYELFYDAWFLGLKGLTVYREGSRDDVLSVSKKEPALVFKEIDAPKRKNPMECDILYMTADGDPYNVFVGLYEGKPYEIFGTKTIISKKSSTGFIKKKKKGFYEFYSDTVEPMHLMENMDNWEKTITILISGQMRHGKHIKYIVKDLRKLPGPNNINSFNRVLARALKKYIKDEETSGNKCPECGTKLTFKGGCEVCDNCGYSKCE